MKALCVLVIVFFCVPLASAREIFFSALESKESVEEEGGTVDGGIFASGKIGNGFVSEKAGDVIHFPTDASYAYMYKGTIELWVKMGVDTAEISGEMFMFMMYARPTDAVFLQFSPGGSAGMRVKSAGAWHDANSAPLDWKKGEIHHMAGT